MRETATVVAVEADAVWVEARRQDTCGACSARKGCGQGLLNELMPGREHYVRALADPADRLQMAVGDQVEVVMPDGAVLAASAVVYLVPLGLMLLGALSGNAFVPGDPAAVLGGLMGLVLGAGAVRWHAGRLRQDERVQPRVVLSSARPEAAPTVAMRVDVS